MPDTPSSPPLITFLIVFVLATCCALWAGAQFIAQTGSNIGYGLLTGLSFGAMFACAQRVKDHLFPTLASTRPSVSGPHPVRRAAVRARPLTVAFDDEFIRTARADAELARIAWQDVEHITITISGGSLPMPYWTIATARVSIGLSNDTPGLENLMEAFKTKLPGYDTAVIHETVISAMGALEGAFDIWQRPA